MSLLNYWREFQEWRHERLDPSRQLIGAPYHPSIEKPKREAEERTYIIRQTHEVELTVKVHSQEELRKWDKTVVIALERPDGTIIESHPSIVSIESYREKPSAFERIDKVERNPSNPPIIQRPAVDLTNVIGYAVGMRNREYTYCQHCEDTIDYDAAAYVWEITQEHTNDGAYTCYACRKTFL